MRIAVVSPHLPTVARPMRGVTRFEQLHLLAAAGHQVRGVVPGVGDDIAVEVPLEIANLHPVLTHVGVHAILVHQVRKAAGNHNPVPARQPACNQLRVPINEIAQVTKIRPNLPPELLVPAMLD